MRVISFSLFGTKDLYVLGTIANAMLVRSIYPGWTMRVYTDSRDARIHRLPNLAPVEIVPMPASEHFEGTFWRFLAAADPQIDAVIFRDADSRLSIRERVAVDAWLDTGKPAHIMRDAPWHDAPIMAGMWGVRGGVLSGIERDIAEWNRFGDKWDDQRFLADAIWPHLELRCLEHGNGGIPFPDHTSVSRYVGEIVEPTSSEKSQIRALLSPRVRPRIRNITATGSHCHTMASAATGKNFVHVHR